MSATILVINAGSSSIKFALFDHDADALSRAETGSVTGLGTRGPRLVLNGRRAETLHDRKWTEPIDHEIALKAALDALSAVTASPSRRIAAIGHRVVHGGTRYSEPAIINDDVVHELKNFVPLAPLHQPHNLAPIVTLRQLYPNLPQVACFDTAFHRTQPEVAQAYALPKKITDEGVRRYGFHGLSYEYIASVLADVEPRAAKGRTIVMHLGNGASMCAMVAGKSAASTMGFTALEGLPMGTRSGAIDPGVILYMMETLNMNVQQVQHVLYHESGLLGVSGISGDMRDLESSEDPAAKRAIDLFVYRIARELGSLSAASQGVDALVFTAGIGEHSKLIRERVCNSAEWLGVTLDAKANDKHGPRISTAKSKVSAWVIPTDEESVIARHTAALTIR